jgi:hypothetical protein
MSAQQENLIIPDVKGMDTTALMKLLKSLAAALKTVTTELEIKSKKPVKAMKVVKEVKVKGPTPLHLIKNNAWVMYAKEHARKNGWEAFSVHQKEGDLEVAASVCREGLHVHDATGKPMIQKEAMSYAKYLWSAKTGTGAHKEIYEAFEAQYGQEAPGAASVEPVKVKEHVAQKAPLKAKKEKKEKKEEWESPTAGNVKPWNHEGETYLRDNEYRVWHAIQGGEVGAWVGIYNPLTDTIDEAEEPLYEDE